jgi:hypothetical protein
MKKILILALLFAVACNSDKKHALVYFEKAQNSYEAGEYESAKQFLDSIKTLFPEEFEVQKQGLNLYRKVEIKVQERNLAFCDSMLLVLQGESETLKSGFLFEKDPEYDDIGKYVDRQQKLENKLQRSYIRISVNEMGELSLASVYYGSHAIHHSRLKVSKAGGDYTETQDIPFDGGTNYSFVDLGMTTEVVTYVNGKDNGVIQFIYNNKDATLKAEYAGGKKYNITISQGDKNALVKTADFAVVLSGIEKLKKTKEKSEKRIEQLQSKTF